MPEAWFGGRKHRVGKPRALLLGDAVALVVDDDAMVGRALDRMLCRAFSVLAAGSVAEAKQWLRAVPRIDLAFVDHDLPDGVGPLVLEELSRRHPGAARVLMSGRERSALSPAGLDVAHVFLAKPLDFRIVRTVQAAAKSPRQLDR